MTPVRTEGAGLLDPTTCPFGIQRNAVVVVDWRVDLDRDVVAAHDEGAIVGQRGAGQVDFAPCLDDTCRTRGDCFIGGAVAFLVGAARVAAASVARVHISVALVQRDRVHGLVDQGRRGDRDIASERLDGACLVCCAAAGRERDIAPRGQCAVQVLNICRVDGKRLAG